MLNIYPCSFSPQHFQVFTGVFETNKKIWHPVRKYSVFKEQEVISLSKVTYILYSLCLGADTLVEVLYSGGFLEAEVAF